MEKNKKVIMVHFIHTILQSSHDHLTSHKSTYFQIKLSTCQVQNYAQLNLNVKEIVFSL